MILAFSFGTFLGYITIAIFIIICVICAHGWSKDIEAMKGMPPEKVENFLDKINDLQKKVDSIEKTLKQIEKDKKVTTPLEESQSPE